MMREDRMFGEILITKHAEQRAKERLGLSFEKLGEYASKSLSEGIDALAVPEIRRLLIHGIRKHDSDGAYMFAEGLFIFRGRALTTVYPVNWIARWPDEDVA